MAAFSHQQHPLLLDSIFSPNSPLKNSGFLDEFFPSWTQFCPTIPLPNHLEGSSMAVSNQESSCIEQQSINSMAEKQGKQSLSTTSMADKAESGEQVTQVCSPDDKKRKSRNGSSSNSANSKDVKQARGKKQKRDKEAKKEEKNDKDQNKAKIEEPPKGYIHVRARRGQATDSHSLAERVRREKISERMKMLQALVPGCDKVTGKALMLDEIINYVQSLQNQVEFLSMRLASLDPMVYNFGLMELDPIMPFGVQGVINNDGMALSMTPMTMSSSSAIVNATSNISSAPSTNLSDVNAAAGVSPNKPINLPNANPLSTTMATTTFPSPDGVDGSNNLFQLGQKPSVLIPQDRSVYLGSGVDDQQRLSFFNQFGFGANN